MHQPHWTVDSSTAVRSGRSYSEFDRERLTTSSGNEAREAHRGSARADDCDDRNECDAGQGFFHDGAQAEGTSVLAHVYLLEVVSDLMGHMIAFGGREDCQLDDIGPDDIDKPCRGLGP
jgi:hypothetical protein